MRIVAAMSGGVDSSVAAALLADEGHDVVGLSMQLYDQREGGQQFGSCCTLDDLNDARRVAARLGIPHYIVNFERQFDEQVVSHFVGEYTADRPGSVTFSPSRPGMVVQRTLSGGSITLTAGSFMACTPGIELKTRFGGLRSLFSGEGLFFVECSGNGELFFNSFGGIVEKDVDGSFVVDTSHVVAWDPGLTFSIRGMGNIKSTLLSGEGLAMEFSGRGKIYLQTRTLGGAASWLTPFLG